MPGIPATTAMAELSHLHPPPCTHVHMHPLPCRRKFAAYKELAQREERRSKVAAVAQHIEQQKLMQAKGHKRKLAAAEPGQAPVFRWKRERSK